VTDPRGNSSYNGPDERGPSRLLITGTRLQEHHWAFLA
jgi:hypothetical protein